MDASFMPSWSWVQPTAISQPAAGIKRVSCVGDSLTFGQSCKKYQSASHGSTAPYPEQLEKLLGSGYTVSNFGVRGAQASRHGHCDWPVPKGGTGPPYRCSYWDQPEWQQVLKSNPDFVTVLLGTNDAKDSNWRLKAHQKIFDADYAALLTAIKSLPSSPKVFVLLPPPTFPQNASEKYYKCNITGENTYETAWHVRAVGERSEVDAVIIDLSAELMAHVEQTRSTGEGRGTRHAEPRTWDVDVARPVFGTDTWALAAGLGAVLTCDGIHLDGSAVATVAEAIARRIHDAEGL